MSFQAINATTGEPLSGTFEETTAQEVDQACGRAADAFPVYRKLSGEAKARFLERIADEIMALGPELLERAHLETALPLARLTGERGRTVGQLRLFAQYVRAGSWVDARIDPALPDRQPLPRPDLRQMLIPLGPVGIFGASNFPLAFSVAGGDTASALAAGCPVVVKAHPAHPGTSELVGQAIRRAVEACGLPEGVFQMVHGTGTEVGMAIVQHPLIKAIGFTGSFRGGKAIYDAAVRRPEPIPVYAEMGSTNPVFFLPAILKDKGLSLAQAYVDSVTLGVGQFCTNPGLAIVKQSDGGDAFLSQARLAMTQTKPAPMLTQGIFQAYSNGVEKLSAISRVHIASKTDTTVTDYAHGHPTLLSTTADAFLEHPELAEEVFGPSSLMVVADTKEEMMSVARNLEGHLTATVHGTPEELLEYADLLEVLAQKVGRLVINGFPTGVEVSHAMNHGGPYPATTDVRTTSVGTNAIRRFARPVCYQGFPEELLPDELKTANPLNIWRLVDGEWQR
ncbi:aldehyde dehydrogenase (NADP(+)) [Larkinella soli]|uniref:aldehyde dehydrogenase (NADP(+)) n=1 Tax=Larkinella soli TaxID=1770527 RepID=UPI000FFC98AA|nr:aldehyde dehydrogenase (NADP(+)) [Larkinella soli]